MTEKAAAHTNVCGSSFVFAAAFFVIAAAGYAGRRSHARRLFFASSVSSVSSVSFVFEAFRLCGLCACRPKLAIVEASEGWGSAFSRRGQDRSVTARGAEYEDARS